VRRSQDLVQSHRKLVREGELWRYPETNKRDTWFLFSDVLLIGTKADRRGKKYRLRHLIQLKQFTVSGISTTDRTLRSRSRSRFLSFFASQEY